jgi:hypothetical protein
LSFLIFGEYHVLSVNLHWSYQQNKNIHDNHEYNFRKLGIVTPYKSTKPTLAEHYLISQGFLEQKKTYQNALAIRVAGRINLIEVVLNFLYGKVKNIIKM